tara:strand:- start:596 stop:976 length:381 start_codon:yes stop_codon:yes gene_type:complete
MDLEILKIASDTNNCKSIKNYTHFSKLKNPICGDEIQIELIIEKNKITDFGYQGKSCIYCNASANLLSKISINEKKNKLDKLCDDAKLFFDGNLKITGKKRLFLKKLFKKKKYIKKRVYIITFQNA